MLNFDLIESKSELGTGLIIDLQKSQSYLFSVGHRGHSERLQIVVAYTACHR